MPSPQAEFSFTAVLRSALRALPTNLHWCFLLFAIPQVIFLALWTPPFQTADETAHFDRAWQIAHLEIGPRYGGYVDASADRLWNCVAAIGFNQEARYTRTDQSCEVSARWTGQTVHHDFPNTGTGALTGYLPQALGIVIGKTAGLGPLHTLELARLLNGAFAVAVCGLALYWCGRGKLVVFALLLMPMSLSLFASCGQDATLIALTCLAFATISRQVGKGARLSRAQAAVVIVSFIVVLVGRPPYVALLPVLLAPGLFQKRINRPAWIPGLLFACLPFAVTVTWWLTATHATRAVAKPIAGIGVTDARLQLINIFHHPGIVDGLLGYAAHHTSEYIAGVIGILGWLDTPMPSLYYLALLLVLAMAAVAELGHGPQIAKSFTVLSIVVFCAGIVAVFLVEYLIWTPVGAPEIYGVQGRYFIPLLIAAAVGLPQMGDSEKSYERLTALVVAAQLITVIVLPKVILARYYAG